jgi:peptidoglycan L-alanyl-D-glutamate endopeptidase CwlK
MPNKLLGVHPDLQTRVPQILSAMAVLGFEMRVTDGLRTLEQQQELYALGRSKPGHIVTNADGVVHPSNHQQKTDGFGHAVDCTFWVEGEPSWAEDLPWRCYGECAKALGLKWGGDWGKPDKPHIELP